jgi:hypothetical protein
MGDVHSTCEDLVVDKVYGGSRQGNSADDPLPGLLGVDNGAGFRHLGRRPNVATLKLLALKTSFADVSWPDTLDPENGRFVYYGDRRSPGELHETPRQGNKILKNLFEEAHSKAASEHFPPIFLFGNTGTYRDVRFLGLAVPGAPGMSADDDLVAVWRMTADQTRFQNYRAIFTILNVPVVSRAWIKDVQGGIAVASPQAPKPWLDWVKGRKFTPLLSQRGCLNFCVRGARQTCPRRRASLATNARRGGQVGASYAALLVNRSS